MSLNKGTLTKTVMVLLISTLFISAASAASVSIEDATSAVGVNTTAQIIAHNVTNLNNFGVMLSYDPSVVIALSAENNANFSDDFSGVSLHDFSHAGEGYVVLMSNPNTATPESDDAVLLTTVTLQAVGGDSCTLGLTVTTLKDSDKADITVDSVSNGTFTVEAGEPTGTYVSIEDATSAVGVNTTAQIIAHNVTNLNNFGVMLSYDPSVVIALSAENNANFSDDFSGVSLHDFSHAGEGYVVLMSNPNTATPESSDAVLLTTVTLQAVGGDSCTLGLTVTTLKDSDKADITVDSVSNGTFTVGGAAAAPTCTVSVTNDTIVPPQTTAITVAFSEKVQYTLNIETDDGTVVYDWTGERSTDRTVTWNGSYEVDGIQVPGGTYKVNLTVTNTTTELTGYNRTETIVVSSGAANQAPTAVIASPTATGTYRVGEEVSFLSTGSSDLEGTIETYTWDFGDGNTSTIASTTHTYTTNGSMTVTLTVTDNEGVNGTETVAINVYPTGTVVVPLYTGWNLIAVPVNDPDANTAAELASKITGCKEVVMWNVSTQMYDPYARVVSTWTGTNFAITGGMGIFVNVEGAATVGFTGDTWS